MITVFVVPHTHWDREWYETAARFRQRLVPVMDEVIEVLEGDASFSSFLLDGQSAIVDDYLAVRPEQRERLAALVRAGRLLVGPWYVLSDELLSSDECLVRNLLAGRRVADALGRTLALGYSPDAFGHPAALPTILAGFGIRDGILWRGYGGEPGQKADLFRWIGPDGSTVTVHHLPAPGYEVGSGLPRDASRLAEKWKALDAMLAPRAAAPVRIITAGADHHAADPHLPEIVRTLEQIAPGHEFRIASPLEYFAAIPRSVRVADVSGELRFSYRYTWTLQGIHSTRSRLKRSIAEGDRLLARWAEPQLALAGSRARESGRPLLRAAWREHLLNHPHDSLGGCVTDEVARDVSCRAAAVAVQARGLLVDALHERLGQDRCAARRGRERWAPVLVVVNPRPQVTSGVVEATVTVFQDDVVVGAPGQATTPPVARTPVLVATDGRAVPMQVLGQHDAYERLDSPRDYPDQDRVRAFRVAVQATDVPALGLQSFRVAANARSAAAPVSPVRATGSRLRAEWGDVYGDAAYGFSFPQAGISGGLAQLESERDQGDTYTFQPASGDRPVAGEWGRSRRKWGGPLVAAISRPVIVGDRARASVSARVDAGSRLVRLVIEGVNLAGNHRLRALFPLPTGLVPRSSVADMQYGTVTRERRAYDRTAFAREWPVTTAPMHRYVTVGDGGRGLTIFSRGVVEYEMTLDGRIAVTLLRAVGDFSRGDLTARPGNAAWPVTTPEAQELGSFRVELGVAPYGVTGPGTAAALGGLERMAEEFHAPLAGLMLRYGIDVPAVVPGPELIGSGLSFKALKPSEAGAGVIARCVNLTEGPVEGRWIWPTPISRAALVRLDETPIQEVEAVGEREIRFTAGPRAIVTILVEDA